MLCKDATTTTRRIVGRRNLWKEKSNEGDEKRKLFYDEAANLHSPYGLHNHVKMEKKERRNSIRTPETRKDAVEGGEREQKEKKEKSPAGKPRSKV